MKNRMFALYILVLAVMCLIAVQPLTPAKAAAQTAIPAAKQLEMDMQEHFSRCLQQQEAAAEEKKLYQLSWNALTAPVPDEEGYGEAESFAELQDVIARAGDVLEGQSLYLSETTKLLPGTPIRYYLDETIFAVTWKEVVNNAVFTCSEVKICHPSQFRRYLSGGEFASGKLSPTTEMAQTVNAVVAGSGDYYSYRRKGYIVWNETALKAKSGVADMCFVDKNGDMRLERGLTFASEKELQAYVDENEIVFSLAFGPILVQDGELACPKSYPLGEVKERFTRAAICQMDNLHYLFVAANMEAGHYGKMTMKEFAQCMLETDCRSAYALDGGQTSSVVMHNELINKVNYGSQRLISDIIYFATAKPTQE